jgi:hypothetical protein
MNKGILVLLALNDLHFLGSLLISTLKEQLVDVDILAFNLGCNVHESLSEFDSLFVQFEDRLGIQLFLILFDLVLDSLDIVDLFHDFVLLTLLGLLYLLLVEESQEISLEVEVLNVLAFEKVLKKSLKLGNKFSPFFKGFCAVL